MAKKQLFMYFTDRERCAIYRLLGIAACADGKFVEKEKVHTAIVAQIVGTTDLDITSMTDVQAMNIIAAMDAEEKKFVCSALGAMIAIDGEVDDRESFVWCLVSERCQFPDMTVLQAMENMDTYVKTYIK